jgi:hypothetical protein
LINTNIQGELSSESIKFKNVVAVSGFGYSGHTALLDLFREYSSNRLDMIMADGKERHFELDYMRLAGGLFEIERFLDSNDVFMIDALLHRTLRLLTSYLNYERNADVYKHTCIYISKLIDYKISDISFPLYNPALYYDSLFPDKHIYSLKSMSLSDYRSLTRRYLANVYNDLYDGSKDTIILDHIFSDGEYDMDKYQEYIPGVKYIVVRRDPRDVYYYAKKYDVKFIAHDSVENFVKNMQRMYSRYDKNSSKYLTVRFEDLALRYDEIVPTIEKYIGINPEDHDLKRKYFNPDISKKNVAIWKQDPSLANDMKYIESKMYELCFHG